MKTTPIERFARLLLRRPLWLALLALAALTVAACGGDGSGPSSDADFPDVIPLGEGEVFPVVVNSALAVGENRFSLGLLDRDDLPVLGADVHLRFFDLTGDEPLFKSESDARFIQTELFFIDEASGQEKRIIGDNGVYVTQVTFDKPDRWGVQIRITIEDRELEPIPFQFVVLEDTPEPSIGDAVPASEQIILADVDDITEIDSSFPPRPHMHGITIADALAEGRPLVVAFATPAFCETRTCGPVMESIMDPLYDEYQDQAGFIHVEPFQLQELRDGTGRIPVPATGEWGLRTEPWVFVVDADGRVAAKFEGITALDEVESVLVSVLGN